MSNELLLASAGEDVKLWDTDGFTLFKQYNNHSDGVSSICWTHDNSCLGSTSISGDKIVLSYPQAANHTITLAEAESKGRTCLAFNSQSKYLMAGGPDSLIHVWDLKSHKLKRTYKGLKGVVTTMQFNYNDTVIAAGSETGEIMLFNVVTGLGYTPLLVPKSQAVRQIQYSHFKKSLLASVCDNGSTNLWDTNTKQLIHSFETAHKAPASGLVFSPLNQMLLLSIGLDKKIICYDVVGKTPVQTMTAESPLTAVDLMFDGATVAVGSTRGKIYVYDLRMGANSIRVTSAHKSSVHRLCFQTKVNQDQDTSNSRNQPANKTASQVSSKNDTQSNREFIPNPADGYGQLHSVTNDRGMDPSDMFSPIRDVDSLLPISNRSDENRPTQKQEPTSRVSSGSKLEPTGRMSAVRDGQASFTADGIFSPLTDTTNTRNGGVEISALPLILDPFSRDSFGQLPAGQSNFDQNSTINNSKGATEVNSSHQTLAALSNIPDSSGQLPSRGSTGWNGKTNDIVRPARLSNQSTSSLLPMKPADIPANNITTSDFGANDSRAKPDSLATPLDAAPRNGEAASASANAEYSSNADHVLPGIGLNSFHVDFLRNIVRDEMEEYFDQMRRDVLNMHVEMLKRFQIQQTEMRTMLEKYSINPELVAEIRRLREENARLKTTF